MPQLFNEWLKERRLERNLSAGEAAERVNRQFGTDYKESAWRQWENRADEDTSRDRCRKVAHALQLPERTVFLAARLLPDEDEAPDLPDSIAALYAALLPEHRQAVDALIHILHEQGQTRDTNKQSQDS